MVLRGKSQIRTVLDRLDNKISQGFGDYVAIKTETPVNKDGTLDEAHGALHFYSQSESASLWCRYLVGDEFLPNGRRRGAPVMGVPKGWPLPNVEVVLQQVRNRQPSEYFVSNGEQVWPTTMPKVSLPKQIWFGLEQLLLNNRLRKKTKVKLLEDINRPGLVGLYAEGHILSCDSPRRQRIEQILWIDPERDDMPVERLSRDYKQDGKTVELKLLTKYLDYAQLSDGRWYPRHWRMTTEIGEQQRKSCREFHLQIFAGMKLDESWFTNPEGQVTNNISEE